LETNLNELITFIFLETPSTATETVTSSTGEKISRIIISIPIIKFEIETVYLFKKCAFLEVN
jgi:hypothetical protein